MLSKVRWLSLSLIVLFSFLLLSGSGFSNHLDDDIRLDVPPDGRVRVENRFGDVTAEVWDKQYVSVSAVVTGGSLTRSPILIDNKGKYLSISTVRLPVNSSATINLQIKIPPRAKLEVNTTAGRIAIRGLSSSALLKSLSGNIDALLDEANNVNLTARSNRGAIQSDFPSKPGPDDHLWQ